MIRHGIEVRSQIDYLMGMDRCLFRKASIWDLWHNSDHFMVLGYLLIAAQQEHSRYLGQRWRFPQQPPRQHTQEDWWFSEPSQDIPKPPPRERQWNT